MKKYTLIRYNRTTGLEQSSLRIGEPKGFRDMEEDLKRDMDVHGVFFSYTSEVEFFNYFYTDETTGQQVAANAYDYIKQAYNEEAANANIQLVVEQDSQIIFDLYLNFESFQDDPLDKIWTITTETRTPFLLKEKQEQKVVINANKEIRLRAKDIIYPSKALINENLTVRPFNQVTFSPTFRWQDAENRAVELRTTISDDANEYFVFSKAAGLIDFELRLRGVIFGQSVSPNINVTISIVIASDPNQANILQTFSQAGVAIYTVNEGGIGGTHIFDITVPNSSYNATTNAYVFVNITTNATNLTQSIGYDSLVSYFNIFAHSVFNGTPCTGSLLKNAFQDVLFFHNFNLSSVVLNDLQDLGSIFLTLGRRIAQGTEDIDIAVNFKDLFDESQKVFNLGYEITNGQIIIESIEYFYDQSTQYTLGEVSDLKVVPFVNFNYNVFQCGYDKYKEDALGKTYENESFNSVREYNLLSSRFESKLSVKTEFITSNFVIEKLRRDIEKQDDDEIYLVALNRTPITSTKYSDNASEQTYEINEVAEGFEPFDDISNDYGGLDEDGLINIRLSPRRIANRWARILKTALYKLPASEQKASFITGEPKLNFVTEGLDEREDIDLSLVDFLFIPEKYELKTYLSESAFTDLKQNHLYHTIVCEYAGQTYAGFLLAAKYNRRTQLAEMSLVATLLPD